MVDERLSNGSMENPFWYLVYYPLLASNVVFVEANQKATTRYFYALKIYGAILIQNKQILCCYFTIKQHETDGQRATVLAKK
jgi:hypothetical protein